MFDLLFVDDPNMPIELCRGRIQIGDFIEDFECSLEFWDQQAYKSQWIEGIERALTGNDSCIISSIVAEPAKLNFLTWWPFYIDGPMAIVQNQLLFLDQCHTPFNLAEPYLSLSSRQSFNDEGAEISEWTIPLHELSVWYSKQVANS